MKHILYHENNIERPYKPQEDSYFHSIRGGIYVVADGVNHDLKDLTQYPMPSDSYEVAKIICEDVVKNLKVKSYSTESIKEAYLKANEKVQTFNESSELYKNRKNNGFTIGAATTAAVWIKDYNLLYGVLDDCFISVFSEDLVDHPILKSYVEISAKYLDSHFKWEETETKRHWREDVRNHKITFEGKEYGYGVIDGREGFEQFLQLGEVNLKEGDLVCVYTDGFIKLIQNKDFIKTLKENPFTLETYKYIYDMANKLGCLKEKTCYFIKID